MGTIYRNGVPFVGSGGAGGVEMTQAEYDLLPTSEKMNGAIYFITDGDVSYPSASQMRYDNTESQIPSTTVQGAIDENRIEINDLKADLNDYIVAVGHTFANTGSVAAGTTKDMRETVPSRSGYTPIVAIPYYSGDDQFTWVRCSLDSNDVVVAIRNNSSSADSGNPVVRILFRKNT